MQLTIDTLIEGIETCKNPTCVGLDTQLAHLIGNLLCSYRTHKSLLGIKRI